MTVTTADPRRLQEDLRALVADHLDYDVALADRAGEFPRSAWQACADFGIQGLPVPVQYGGQGADPVATALVLEELGAVCRDNGLLFALGAQLWSCEIPLLLFGTEDVRRRYLPGLCGGRLVGVQAMSEPGTGSDAFSLTATATPTDDGFLLDGLKTWVTNAPSADLFIVFARTGGVPGFAGISAFVVDATLPGVTVGEPLEKMGLRTVRMAEVRLDQCRVRGEALLNGQGGGMAVFHRSMEWERSFILAGAIGTMTRQLDECVAFARDRRRFGQPIADFQAVGHKLADMRVRLHTARLVLHDVARRKAAGVHDHGAAAVTKLHLSESFVRSSADALTLHAATGYLSGSEAERNLRDAYAALTYSGTSEIQRSVIAGGLGS